jgi:hypothetical protein
VLPVPAVAGIAVAPGAVPGQVDEDRLAVRRLAAAEPVRLAQPDHVGEGEAGLGGDAVLERGMLTNVITIIELWS